MIELQRMGWTDFFEQQYRALAAETLAPGRIIGSNRGLYWIASELGEIEAAVSGRFRYSTQNPSDFPAVGDWVLWETAPHERKGTIHHVLERRTKFSRRTAGNRPDEQIAAANVDDVFIVVSVTALNLRRIERYLTLAWASGAQPSLVLTKVDLIGESQFEDCLAELKSLAEGLMVHAVSTVTGAGMVAFERCLQPGRTVVLLGPSGVGKSSLINFLARDANLAVQPVREKDQKGRHTTTTAELFALPSGVLFIDTPGMRELQLWEAGEGIDAAFEDVEALATACRFSNCRHETEPGCAVLAAVQRGELDAGRAESHRKLRREMRDFERAKAAPGSHRRRR